MLWRGGRLGIRGLGIGDWGLGIGDWGQGRFYSYALCAMPSAQFPMPHSQFSMNFCNFKYCLFLENVFYIY